MTRRISAIFPLLLISLACVLVVEGLYRIVENKLFVTSDEKKIAASIPEKKQTVALVRHTADDDIRIILDRNLFGLSPTDISKQQPESVATENLQATSLDLVLLGTIIGENDGNRAILMEKAKKKQDIYQQGEMIQEAVLKEILRGRVVLTYKGRDQVLDMVEASRSSSKAPIAAGNEVRQEEIFPEPEPEILPPETEAVESEMNEQAQDNPAAEPAPAAEQNTAEMASPPAEAPVTEVQPKTIRPVRRFTIELPSQSSE